MKIAYVHDWLVFPGGAEKVLFDIIEATNTEDIETLEQLEYNEQRKNFIKQMKEEGIYAQENEYKIFTAFHKPDFPNPTNIKIESVLGGKNIGKYFRNLMPIFPIISMLLSKKIRNYNPDILIISSFALGKNIKVNTKKILYLHSVMQYIWTHYNDYLTKFSGIKKIIYKLSAKYLRVWDKRFNKFDRIFFNSNYTKENYKNIYHIDAKGDILFPIVNKPNYKKINLEKKYGIKGEYYLYIGRLVRLVKNLDIIINTFNKIDKQLIIVGDGPDKKYLKSLVKNTNIKFVGHLNNKSNEYWTLLEDTKALINITKESFGIVNYQAYLTGTPLVSINDGAINDIPGKKILIDNFEDLINIIS